jgi:hypothetical protein
MGFRSKRVAAAARMSPTARTPRSFIVLVLETERVTEAGRPQTTLDLAAAMGRSTRWATKLSRTTTRTSRSVDGDPGRSLRCYG